ncbi:MAG: VOC family protein [Bacteroidota bacterium]|jgi:glyoxalase family protein
MKNTDYIKGIHHVTATVNDAQEDYHFYTHILGMRLIKKTVNFDNHNVYHFYYGDQVGTPSTIFTTFPYKGQPKVQLGEEGTGLIIATALSVPAKSLPFWTKRLLEFGIIVTEGERFGQSYLWFRDPSGLQIELIGDENDTRKAWISAGENDITDAEGVKGIHHVTLSIAPEHWDLMLEFLQSEMNMSLAAQENNRVRLNVNGGGAGKYLEMRRDEQTSRGRNGIGTVHHVAWIVEDDNALMTMRDRLIERGFVPTDMKDRKYFHSVYFRPYAGMWFEMATLQPGFTIDEPEQELGEHLLLPEWEEVNRAEIEANLPKVG